MQCCATAKEALGEAQVSAASAILLSVDGWQYNARIFSLRRTGDKVSWGNKIAAPALVKTAALAVW